MLKHIRPLILIGPDGSLSCWGKKKNKGLWALLKDNRGSWSPDWGFPETCYLVKSRRSKACKNTCWSGEGAVCCKMMPET